MVTSGSRGWAKFYVDEGDLFIRVTNLTRDCLALDLSDTKFVEPPEGSEGQRTAVLPGDIMVSITADLGRVAIAPPSIGRAYVNQHVGLIRLDADVVDPEFAGYCLLSAHGQEQFTRLNDKGTKAASGTRVNECG